LGTFLMVPRVVKVEVAVEVGVEKSRNDESDEGDEDKGDTGDNGKDNDWTTIIWTTIGIIVAAIAGSVIVGMFAACIKGCRRPGN